MSRSSRTRRARPSAPSSRRGSRRWPTSASNSPHHRRPRDPHGQDGAVGHAARARHVLADWHQAGRSTSSRPIDAALEARREWASWPWEDRAAVFLKAAELLATTWRATVNAATMLGQSKTAFQAEIDAACELIDFWRFNAGLRAGALRRAADLRSPRSGTSSTTGRSRASSTR